MRRYRLSSILDDTVSNTGVVHVSDVSRVIRRYLSGISARLDVCAVSRPPGPTLDLPTLYLPYSPTTTTTTAYYPYHRPLLATTPTTPTYYPYYSYYYYLLPLLLLLLPLLLLLLLLLRTRYRLLPLLPHLLPPTTTTTTTSTPTTPATSYYSCYPYYCTTTTTTTPARGWFMYRVCIQYVLCMVLIRCISASMYWGMDRLFSRCIMNVFCMYLDLASSPQQRAWRCGDTWDHVWIT